MGASERLVALLLMLDGDPVLICPAFEEGSLDAVLKIPVAKYLWEEHDDPYVLVVQAMNERHAHALALDPALHSPCTPVCAPIWARRFAMPASSSMAAACASRRPSWH